MELSPRSPHEPSGTEQDTTANDVPIAHGEMPWQLRIPLNGDALRRINPVPTLAGMLSASGIPEQHRDVICTLLSEMYSNAVEHGVLAMDSTIKQHEAGYVDYYTARIRDLPAVGEGFINITLEYSPQPQGAVLILRIQDSGQGFSVDPHQQHSPADDEAFHGMDLMRSLCEKLTYDRDSNTLEAIYRWHDAPASG